MLETYAQSPDRGLAPKDRRRCLGVVALLRALTPEEAAALFRDQQLPERLAEIATEVELPVEECERVLTQVIWRFTEGLHPR